MITQKKLRPPLLYPLPPNGGRGEGEGGFTIVEFVLVIALMGILGALLAPPLTAAVRAYALVVARNATLTDARLAMDQMVKEIRLIPSSADILDVSSSTRFQFEYPDGTPVTYDLSGSDLRRNGDVMVSGLTTLSFKYYNATGGAAATADALRRVQISWTLTVPGNGGRLSLRTHVFLRNTGNNYDGFTLQ